MEARFFSALVLSLYSAFFIIFRILAIDLIHPLDGLYTGKKENKIFLKYKEIQKGAVAKPYMRKGFLIYEEMRTFLIIYEEALSYI
jgi:hypothetical protein